MTCLLKSKPVTDLGGIALTTPFTSGAFSKNPKPNTYSGDRVLKKPGSKSTFKMSSNLTSCSQGWWHITGERMWFRNLYSHGGALYPAKGRILPGPSKSYLPSECVKQAKSFS